MSSSTFVLVHLILLITSSASLLVSSENKLDMNSSSNHLKTTISKVAEYEEEGLTYQHIWCVASNNTADVSEYQIAIDWACGREGADCQPTNKCFDTNDIKAIATYVFNDYFERNDMKTEANCDFKGLASISTIDPSYNKCIMKYSSALVREQNLPGKRKSTSASNEIVIWSPVVLVTALLFALMMLG